MHKLSHILGRKTASLNKRSADAADYITRGLGLGSGAAGYGLLGSGIGALQGGKGNRAEGAGRGLATGAGVGAGMAVGGMASPIAHDLMGGRGINQIGEAMQGILGKAPRGTGMRQLISLLAGVGGMTAGGVAGYKGTQHALGKPSWERTNA